MLEGPLPDDDDGCTSSEVRFRAWVSALTNGVRPSELRGDSGAKGLACDGEAESEGVLKGMNETDGRRWTPDGGGPSTERSDDLELWADLTLGKARLGGDDEADSGLRSRAARRAERGLDAIGGPAWWKDERLPYAWLRSGSSTGSRRSDGSEPSSLVETARPASRSSGRANEGRNRPSSTPMSCELNRASASSTRNSQLVRYATVTEKGPAGDSVAPKENSSVTRPRPLPVDSGDVRPSTCELSEVSSAPRSTIRQFTLRARCSCRGLELCLANFQAGKNLEYVYSDRNSTILFLYTTGRSVFRSAGWSTGAGPSSTVQRSKTTLDVLEATDDGGPRLEFGEALSISSTLHRLP